MFIRFLIELLLEELALPVPLMLIGTTGGGMAMDADAAGVLLLLAVIGLSVVFCSGCNCCCCGRSGGEGVWNAGLLAVFVNGGGLGEFILFIGSF